jgi:hypothetical protein
MIPHERSLVERMKDRPFVLLGVNTDSDKDEYRKQAAEMGVTWRSAWQGGMGGEVPKRYMVSGYPTLFLLDADGVIRKYWLGSPSETALDEAILELVEQAERKRDL